MTRGETTRSTRTVLESHLELARRDDLETDLRDNYAPDVLLMSAEGIHHGHDGVRVLASVLREYTTPDGYVYQDLLVEDEIGLLTWSASGHGVTIHDGADTFVVRDGRIVAQTIHFSTRHG